MRKLFRRISTVSPTRTVALGFLAIILIGAVLLSLPAATRNEGSCGFVNALFTATSATCVTGLAIGDTWQYWTNFGQVVILVMIQIGGLGFMTLAMVFSFLLRRKIGLRQRLIIVQSLNLNDINGVVRLVRHVLIGTLAFEGAGAVILTCCFVPRFGFAEGLWRGVFHSISAFCNAGFDIMGKASPNSSLALYAEDPIVNIVIMTLIVVGGLGFFVWEDIVHARSWKKLRIHSRIVIVTTVFLIVAGAVAFSLMEWTNPATIGDMPVGSKLLCSTFQSVTTRTAGFATVDQAGLTGGSKLLTMLLMFIGGSPGSTAGGVKTVTIAVLMISALRAIRGHEDVNIFGRRISQKQVRDCLAIVVVVVMLYIIGTTLIMGFEQIEPMDAIFEVSSAMGTVGLTLGVTQSLGVPALLVLIVLMYLGRVGIMTIGIATMINGGKTAKVRYPEERIMIG